MKLLGIKLKPLICLWSQKDAQVSERPSGVVDPIPSGKFFAGPPRQRDLSSVTIRNDDFALFSRRPDPPPAPDQDQFAKKRSAKFQSIEPGHVAGKIAAQEMNGLLHGEILPEARHKSNSLSESICFRRFQPVMA